MISKRIVNIYNFVRAVEPRIPAFTPEVLRETTARQIDRRLLAGSTIFGIGWGLAGSCPGPALVLLGAGSLKGIVFTVALLAGMAVFEIRRR